MKTQIRAAFTTAFFLAAPFAFAQNSASPAPAGGNPTTNPSGNPTTPNGNPNPGGSATNPRGNSPGATTPNGNSPDATTSTRSRTAGVGGAITDQQATERIGKLSREEKASLYDGLTDKDKSSIAKGMGQDWTKLSERERNDTIGKMSPQDKADAYDHLPMDQKVGIMRGGH